MIFYFDIAKKSKQRERILNLMSGSFKKATGRTWHRPKIWHQLVRETQAYFSPKEAMKWASIINSEFSVGDKVLILELFVNDYYYLNGPGKLTTKSNKYQQSIEYMICAIRNTIEGLSTFLNKNFTLTSEENPTEIKYNDVDIVVVPDEIIDGYIDSYVKIKRKEKLMKIFENE